MNAAGVEDPGLEDPQGPRLVGGRPSVRRDWPAVA